ARLLEDVLEVVGAQVDLPELDPFGQVGHGPGRERDHLGGRVVGGQTGHAPPEGGLGARDHDLAHGTTLPEGRPGTTTRCRDRAAAPTPGGGGSARWAPRRTTLPWAP